MPQALGGPGSALHTCTNSLCLLLICFLFCCIPLRTWNHLLMGSPILRFLVPQAPVVLKWPPRYPMDTTIPLEVSAFAPLDFRQQWVISALLPLLNGCIGKEPHVRLPHQRGSTGYIGKGYHNLSPSPGADPPLPLPSYATFPCSERPYRRVEVLLSTSTPQ